MPPTRDSCRRRPMQRPDSALQLPCDQPGCNRWFRNLSGLTKHKRTTHPSFSHPHQSFSDHAELLGSSEEEDPAADRTPLLPEHAFDGYRAEDPLNPEHEAMRTEYVGPSGRLYCNYHPGLNARRCDELGQFLPANAPPPPRAEKSPDDWAPYRNWLEFELADFLFTHAEMPARKIDTLLDIWAVPLIQLALALAMSNGITSSFGTQAKSKAVNLHLGCPTATKFGIETHMKSSMAFSQVLNLQMNWTMSCIENTMLQTIRGVGKGHGSRRILRDDPTTAGATLVPIILGSDKTTILVATGQTDYYPLYLSIRNVPETILFGNSYYRRVIYALAAYIADYEEQVLLSCIVRNWCPKCLGHCDNLDEDALRRSREHCDTIIEEFELCQLWDSYGIVGDIILFTNDFLHADIHAMLSLDILHQLIKGGFKDHLVDWVEQYLVHIHGKAEADKILDNIDRWIAAIVPFSGLRFTSQLLKGMYRRT
ncbi:hypothetical protein BKA83DRAFT_4128217 [Pisolithus microcarpus]|nr:hypothetical protein BKA83DRAFT_4128217 [Pisolithus microcarpus]